MLPSLHWCMLRLPNDHRSNISMQFWLLGYEFPTTLMLLTQDTLYILTTPKKGSRDRGFSWVAHWHKIAAKHLDSLKGGRFPIEVLVRGKDATENEQLFIKITETINSAGVSFLDNYRKTFLITRSHRKNLVFYRKIPPKDHLLTNGRRFMLKNAKKSRKWISH